MFIIQLTQRLSNKNFTHIFDTDVTIFLEEKYNEVRGPLTNLI